VTPTSGTVYERSFDDGQLYYVYVSPAAERDPSGARLLVSVHGYGGRTLDADGRDRVKRAATRWAEVVDDNGWIALAPQFDQDRFDNDYQRLNFGGDLRADDRLHALIERVGEAYPGLVTDTFYLWGFSGGGQFAHRYTLFHPTRVERAVVGAPGWYVFPDTDLPYAVGLDPETLPADRSPKWSEFSKVPILVTVGAEDGGGGAFRESYYYDGTNYNLKDLQGEGRAARARNWVDAVNTELTERSLPQNVTLEVIPGLGHSINADMRDGVESFLRAE
jgi:pimeloyl-ACP methyl ester carboxylesterase